MFLPYSFLILLYFLFCIFVFWPWHRSQHNKFGCILFIVFLQHWSLHNVNYCPSLFYCVCFFDVSLWFCIYIAWKAWCFELLNYYNWQHGHQVDSTEWHKYQGRKQEIWIHKLDHWEKVFDLFNFLISETTFFRKFDNPDIVGHWHTGMVAFLSFPDTTPFWKWNIKEKIKSLQK